MHKHMHSTAQPVLFGHAIEQLLSTHLHDASLPGKARCHAVTSQAQKGSSQSVSELKLLSGQKHDPFSGTPSLLPPLLSGNFPNTTYNISRSNPRAHLRGLTHGEKQRDQRRHACHSVTRGTAR
jgi:hypothetical protein